MTTRSKICGLALSASFIALTGCASVNTAGNTTARASADTKTAKNVILFVGDGMGISTITAARIFDGQSKGMNGEGNSLSFEKFPNLSLVKTYNLDSQVADSAGTASALNTGMKTQIGKINVQPDGLYASCVGSSAKPPATFADLAKKSGRSVGVVSTARLTHATPAAVYGHGISRSWEDDTEIDAEGKALGCTDFAAQLIGYGGDNGLDLALGGGRRNFTPTSEGGSREDGRNLTAEWAAKGADHVYAANANALRALNPAEKQAVLGLFNNSHLSFETDRDDAAEPSLTELTNFAIKSMQARGTGYYLMIEGGRIDHAHHGINAYRALSETQELARAVAEADRMTDDEDTLILVTADHSHVFTIAGYPAIGNPILGLVHQVDRETGYPKPDPVLALDGKPYTTLGYHNGTNTRTADDDLSNENVQSKDYKQQTAVELYGETHGGEDVALFAKGPGADQVKGVIDQAEIFDIMTNAAGLD